MTAKESSRDEDDREEGDKLPRTESITHMAIDSDWCLGKLHAAKRR